MTKGRDSKMKMYDILENPHEEGCECDEFNHDDSHLTKRSKEKVRRINEFYKTKK